MALVRVALPLEPHAEAGIRIAEGIDQARRVVVTATRTPYDVAVEQEGAVEDVALERVAPGLDPDLEVVRHYAVLFCLELEDG